MAPNHQLMSWWCESIMHVAEEWEPGRSRLPLIFFIDVRLYVVAQIAV